MMPTMNMYRVKSMNVLKFILMETGTYNDQVLRPFETHLELDTLKRLERHMELQRPAQFNQPVRVMPTMLAPVAGEFLSLSATPQAQVAIPNGWGLKRYRFMLEVLITRQDNSQYREVILGYSENSDAVSPFSRYVDPNQKFWISNVIENQPVTMNTPAGLHQHPGVIRNHHVLLNQHYQHALQPGGVTLRPEDVVSEMQLLPWRQDSLAENIISTGGHLTQDARFVARQHSTAANFVSNVVDAFTNANFSSPTGGFGDDETIRTALGTLRTDAAEDDCFLQRLRELRQSPITPGFFTFGELLQLDPSAAQRTHAKELNAYERSSLHQAGGTAQWAGSDGETRIAAVLAQSVPAYLMDALLVAGHFKATNHTLGGQIEVTPVAAMPLLDNYDVTPQLRNVCWRLAHELFKSVSYNSQLPFLAEVKCDLMGETWIEVSLNSGPMIMFVAPSFADHLMTPQLSYDVNGINAMASDFYNLMNHVGEAVQTARPLMTGPTNLV